jgi:hypothetical protein
MASSMIADFIKAQQMLMKGGGTATPTVAPKTVVRPEVVRVAVDESDPEALYNEIIEKKPGAKKVLKFLQMCIDSIVNDED